MRQSAKPLLVSFAALAVIVLFLHFSSKKILLESFARIEENEAVKNVQRVLSAVGDDLKQLDSITSDYSGWDEAYRFILDGNAGFVETNLDTAIYPKQRLNFLSYVRSSGAVVFLTSFDLRAGKGAPASAGLMEHIRAGSRLISHANPKSAVSGIILLPEGPMLVASRPVLTSDYKGPIHGCLVMGRYLDSTEAKRLSDITHLPLAFHRFDDPRQPENIRTMLASLSQGSPVAVKKRSDTVIDGYGLLTDISGKPALFVKVAMPRKIYGQGVKAAYYFIAWIVVMLLVSALTGNFLYGKIARSRTERQEAENRYRSVISQASDGILLIETEQLRIQDANSAFQQMLGYAPGELEALSLYDIMIDDQTGVDWHVKRIVDEKICRLGEHDLRRKDGTTAAVEINANLVCVGGRHMISMVVRDNTERKRHEGEIIFMANHDPLTGLPNRALFLDRLNQAVFKKERSKKMLAVLFLDLDQFKLINDSLGHHTGDALLKEVAKKLKGVVRKADTVSRLGGDEFTLILDDITAAEDSIIVAKKIIEAFASPFLLGAHEVFVSASIGITLFPSDSTSAEDLLKNADTAMYHAKEKGRNNYQFFSEELNSKVCERLALEGGLRRALERGELLLHYQPRIDMASGAMIGIEALIRWQHPERGLIPPARFIPLAEESGLIVPIGEWVIRTACYQNKAWQDAGLQPLKVSVNLSVRQFCQHNLVRVISNILEETGLAPGFLELEITESVVMVNPEEAIVTLTELKELGISIALDDFGTGYSSLMHLKRLPLDIIKVDKNFTQGIAVNKSDETLVSTIINMGHNLGLHVVAEGVETKEQMLFLGQRFCQEVQGFYFSKPLPSASLRELLEKITSSGSGDIRDLLEPSTHDEQSF